MRRFSLGRHLKLARMGGWRIVAGCMVVLKRLTRARRPVLHSFGEGGSLRRPQILREAGSVSLWPLVSIDRGSVN